MTDSFDANLAIVERLDDGQRLDAANALLQQELAPMLKLLLNDKAHALDTGSCLLAEVYDALARIAEGQEVIDEQHMVFSRQVFLVDNHMIRTMLRERTNLGLIEV